jgi:hypothetical protein
MVRLPVMDTTIASSAPIMIIFTIKDITLKQLPKRPFLLPTVMLILLAATQMAHAHGISAADRAAMLTGGYTRYIGLGASHMLTGYDHLLFLSGSCSS